MPFTSRAQQRLFFSNPKLKKYAHKWAHETGEHHGKKGSKAAYSKLPERVKRTKRTKRRG